jgi:hypothetical protein
MAYANRSSQKRDLGIVEDLEDQAHAPMGAGRPAIMDGDPGRLLPSVLQSK